MQPFLCCDSSDAFCCPFFFPHFALELELFAWRWWVSSSRSEGTKWGKMKADRETLFPRWERGDLIRCWRDDDDLCLSVSDSCLLSCRLFGRTNHRKNERTDGRAPSLAAAVCTLRSVVCWWSIVVRPVRHSLSHTLSAAFKVPSSLAAAGGSGGRCAQFSLIPTNHNRLTLAHRHHWQWTQISDALPVVVLLSWPRFVTCNLSSHPSSSYWLLIMHLLLLVLGRRERGMLCLLFLLLIPAARLTGAGLLSVCLSVCLPTFLFTCLTVCLSVPLCLALQCRCSQTSLTNVLIYLQYFTISFCFWQAQITCAQIMKIIFFIAHLCHYLDSKVF